MTDREAMQIALEALEDVFGKNKVDVGAITALRERLEQPERQALQAAGTHPAPCARHCEAKAFEIEIRSLKSALRNALEQQAEPVPNQFNAGIEACMSRLHEMHRIASGRHNYYGHAALELAKLKGKHD